LRAATRIGECEIARALDRRETDAPRHRRRLDDFAADECFEVAPELGTVFRARRELVGLVRGRDDGRVDARIHARRVGLPDEDEIVLAVVLPVGAPQCAAPTVRRADGEQDRARKRREPGADGEGGEPGKEGAPNSGAPLLCPRVAYWMGTVALKTRLFPWKTLMVAVPPKVGVISSGQEPEAQTFANVI
jgi:hypothetical protein